ncbi:AraC family transcriptional regulator [Jeotgalibaca sp. MA1X17-3]|uniref:helix-turn-helix domain-containing protein n=1 Tax=Jeotgalibaca sp. MA1X17-3 TaxID=2908211 RepID=UPI001F32883F|nr:helix-turn-helix domain-containing protein [Jeotgalibaca sp. MA1X17-3]UJF15535.1 AraC family transcriptional regulator [Jeotgalibaca sp. MA1X17-3]
MTYQTELHFVQKLLEKFCLKSYILSFADGNVPELPFELRYLIYGKAKPVETVEESLKKVDSNTVYQVLNEYHCNYILFRFPDPTKDYYFLIGPYLQKPVTKLMILKSTNKHSVSHSLFLQLEQFYTSLPLILDDSTLLAIINTLGESIWGGLEQFSLKHVNQLVQQQPDLYHSFSNFEEEDSDLLIRTLEERYAIENDMMRSVSQGLTHTKKMLTPAYANYGIQQRLTDSIRNLKNYMIILNTILRKAAEEGFVHPLHIDRVSSKFAQEIELINSSEKGFELEQKMIYQYSLLVKNHTMKGYSFLISQVIAYIDSNLAADLSLKAHAERLNVNASYLSTLFKKETGKTLTDYVNCKRIDYAIILLHSTTLQIQTIAQYCGILDVNYFTKIFKKYIGQTPKKYRDSLL